MIEFWRKVDFKGTPKNPKKVKVEFHKRKPQTKPSKIYVVFESDTRSPMEILTLILNFAEEREIRTPDFLALDYPGCDDPGEVSINYTGERTP